jgi:hypothetical protein
MKTLIFFALALILSSGVLAQEAASDRQQPQETKAEKSSAVPSTIDFQGRLHDSGGNPVNATMLITFTLYDMLAGGSILWSEDYMVEIMDGLFQVKLGQINPITPDLFAEPDRWLGIRIGGEAELSPRTKISSAGYALQAPENDPTWLGAPELSSAIGRTGNVGIGTISPEAILEVAGGDAIINDLSVGKGGGSHLANSALGFSALASNTTGIYNTAVGNATLFNNESGEKNSAFGFRALFSNTSGHANTANGMWALFSNTTGSSNVANGVGALYHNTDRSNLVAIGDSALFNNGLSATFPFEAHDNTAVGSKALYANTKGYQNSAMGFKALYNNTTGYSNTATGFQALYNNTTGFSNTAIGHNVLNSNTTGFYNVAIGIDILFDNISGNRNCAIGTEVLYKNTNGSGNTAIGDHVLYHNTTGSENIAIGYEVLFSNETGGGNIAIGTLALHVNKTGDNNIAIGRQALNLNQTGTSNIALGIRALNSNTDRSNLVAIGDSALFHNGLYATDFFHGSVNTAIGSKALFSNTTGYNNTAIGTYTLYSNITGAFNTASGADALHSNTIGFSNTANGASALYSNTIGVFNTASGAEALYYNSTGNHNTANGLHALYSNTSGIGNTASGTSALYYNSTGDHNTAIGADSGNSSVVQLQLTGQKNTFIGSNTSYSNGSITNSTALGADVTLSHSNTVILGNDANVGIGTSNPAYKLDIAGALNLNKGIASGVALRINGAETILYNGTYFSFGFGNSGNYSVFGRSLCIGTASNPGTHHLVVNGTAAKPGGGSWETWSDINLKTLHGNYERGLNEISALVPVRYSYNEENPLALPSQREFIGLIAQDVQEFLPEAVSVDHNGYLMLDMNPVNVAMINAIKELKAENDELKARLERLERAIETMAEK